MLLSRGKITEDLIDIMMGWRHFWFNVYCRPRIQPYEVEAMDNLARYTCLPIFMADYPRLLFPGEPALVRPVCLS